MTAYGRVRFFKRGSDEPLVEEVNWRADAPVLYAASRELQPLESDLYRAELRLRPTRESASTASASTGTGCSTRRAPSSTWSSETPRSTIPFTLSSRGYGFLWNNPAVGRVELGTNGTRWVADATRQIDYLVMTGASPAAIMERYADTTGPRADAARLRDGLLAVQAALPHAGRAAGGRARVQEAAVCRCRSSWSTTSTGRGRATGRSTPSAGPTPPR